MEKEAKTQHRNFKTNIKQNVKILTMLPNILASL